MPIGFDAGDFGGSRRPSTPARRPPDPWSHRPAPEPADTLDPWRHDPSPAPAPPVELGFWAWVEVDASTVHPVAWTRWFTVEDERVCPECGPLDGEVWPEGDGPSPPLHVNCRCERRHAFTEWRVRPATTWQLRWIPA